MPVSIAVQSAIAQRYAQLGNAVTHNPAEEERVLAPQFQDRAKLKLTSFEYDPLTILVQKIVVHGNDAEVHAEYVGIHGHNAQTIDHWTLLNGEWRLTDRT